LGGFFLGGRFLVFCWGFWEKEAENRGVLLVNLWWICGETWCFVTAFSSTKNLPRIADLFSGIPVLGIVSVSAAGIVRLSSSE
jgi:hypothetical protein